MASSIEPRPSFLHRLHGNEKKPPSNPTNTDEKASVVANDTLEKSSTKWYVKLPLAQNGKPSVAAKLPPGMVNVISATLKTPQTKAKQPTPPSRSSTTCLSLMPEHSETGKQETFGPDLPAVIKARKALNSSEKKILPLLPSQENKSTIPSMTSPIPRKRTLFLIDPQTVVDTNILKPPIPPPQENKPKYSVTVSSPLFRKRVTFQEDMQVTNLQNITKTLETNLPKTPNMLSKPFFHEENTEYKRDLDSAIDELNKVLEEFEIDPIVK